MFNDRIVVESPGNLPGLVRPENIRHTHFSRNQRIAQYLKAYTYVKEFGEGVDRMCREMEEKGLPTVRYKKIGFILQATAYSSMQETANPPVNPPVNLPVNLPVKLAEQILDYLKNNPNATYDNLADEFGKSRETIRVHIKNLQAQGLLRRVGPDKTGHWEVT